MSEHLIIPDLDGIPEDETAEPDNAEVEHTVPPEELDES